MSIIVNGQTYVLVSRQKGEYSGPCPFGRGGDDRAAIWPARQDNAPGDFNFYCRKECSDCPGIDVERVAGGGTTGWIGDAKVSGKIVGPDGTEVPGMDKVLEYHKSLNADTVEYLRSRGIQDRAIRNFLIGTNERRFTIPCIAGGKCHGIKKRWIGTPPKKMIAKYTMVPGSKAVAIFNYDRLMARKRWDYILIVEAPLDVMAMDQMGIPAICPFGGGGVWSPSWLRSLRHVETIIHVADYDEAGLEYAKKRKQMLKRGVITYPPGAEKLGLLDMNEAYAELGPVVIREWLIDVQTRSDKDE